MAIAVGLIVLMAITAVLSMVSVVQVGNQIRELTNTFIPAYGDLARTNIRSLERALALRRMVIQRLRSPSDAADREVIRDAFERAGQEVEREADAARALISGLIERGNAFGDTSALARLESRIDTAMKLSRRHLNAEIERLLVALDTGDTRSIDDALERVDTLRDELNSEIESIRSGMLAVLKANAEMAVRKQRQALFIATILTVLAAALGLVVAMLVSSGLTMPIRRLLESTRAIEAGRLEETLAVTSSDEIGHLTTAFNRMVEQLRHKERIRETFGKYIDPRVVDGLIDRPALAAEGQRRVMTVLFCDVKGFSSASEGMTAQGLVKIMNRYFSTMSAPIRKHGGIIDKYIGDAIMAYWGPPFTEDTEQMRLASLAAVEMVEQIVPLRAEFPELLGLRTVPISFDLRIGIATGEALVGSIGSDLMMSYTVMGETVNLASRLEGANKTYGTRILVSEATATAVSDAIEAREIDRVVMQGQTKPQVIFEIMGRKGELTPTQIELRSLYEEGLAAYRNREWEHARKALAAALEAAPNDGPSSALMERVDLFAKAPPSDDWDKAWRLDQK